MHVQSKVVFNALLSLGLVVFISFGFLGLSHTNGGVNSSCPFMPGHTSFCKMQTLEHLQAWQSLVTMLPTGEMFLALSVLVALLALLNLNALWKVFLHPRSLTERYLDPFYVREIFIFVAFKEAFARGVLNTKAY